MAGIESLLIDRILGGRYRIEEVIGRGGMGAVYRAVDERLGRQVALKVITVAGTGDLEGRERLRARFFREARSAAALPHHPNVVPVYDYGSDETLGLDYIVMELLRGSDLATRLARSGPPPLPTSLTILTEAARGIAVGHQQGLIHRDVKPGNIFLTRTHANNVQVRVVDFGIAKLADDEDTLAQLTQDGRVPHSPAYASPEQLRGLSHLTPAADVFGLGAVGFQLLTGERPFSDSDRNKISLGMPVSPPSIRERNPAVPASVEAVILRALAFDPVDRYQDAGAMADDLEIATRSITSSPLDPYIAGGVTVTVTEDADEGSATMLDPADEDDDRTQIADVAQEDHTLVTPVGGEPGGSSLPPLKSSEPGAATAIPPLPPSAEPSRGWGGRITWGLVGVVLVAAGVLGWQAMQGPTDLSLGVPEADSLDVALQDTAPDPSVLAALEALEINNDGVIASRAGRIQEAVRHFARAVELAPGNWDYRRNYGSSLYQVGRLDEALRELQLAIRSDPSRALAYANLGQVQLALGDTVSAIRSYESYLERETDAGQRALAERTLREIETIMNPDVPLLGEPILGPRPGDPPSAADTLTSPVRPGGG